MLKPKRILKTFTLNHKRYRIVALFDKGTKDGVSRVLKMYDGLETGAKRLPSGQWAVGIRIGSIGRSGLKVR